MKYKNAYIIYLMEKKQILNENDPDLNNKNAIKKIAEEWRKISEEEKEKYKLLAKNEKDKFLSKKIQRKYKAKAANLQPKNIRTAFMFYISEKKDLKEETKYKIFENIKIFSEKWRNMTEQEKMPYNKKALLDKERFQIEWNDYIKLFMRNRNAKFKVKNAKEKYKIFLMDLINLGEN